MMMFMQTFKALISFEHANSFMFSFKESMTNRQNSLSKVFGLKIKLLIEEFDHGSD